MIFPYQRVLKQWSNSVQCQIPVLCAPSLLPQLVPNPTDDFSRGLGMLHFLDCKNKGKKRLPENVTQAAIMFPPKHIQQTKLVIYIL